MPDLTPVTPPIQTDADKTIAACHAVSGLLKSEEHPTLAPVPDQPTTTISAPSATSVSTTTAPIDLWLARTVIYALTAIAIVSTIGALVAWAITGTKPPGELWVIAAGAGGSIGTFLTKPHG